MKKYIEVDSLKEINELFDNKKLYWKNGDGEYLIHVDGYISTDGTYYKKNPKHKTAGFNKYFGKFCRHVLTGNHHIISYYNYDGKYFIVGNEKFTEDKLLNNYIIEGINDK